MRISKDAVPSLVDAVKITLEEELAAQDSEDFDPERHYDPNDLILFEAFVLPVLEDALESGFDSGDMDGKGFGLLIGLIPWYLNSRSGALGRPVCGVLAKIYYTHMLEEALSYMNHIAIEHLWENIGNINRRIEPCLLIEGQAARGASGP